MLHYYLFLTRFYVVDADVGLDRTGQQIPEVRLKMLCICTRSSPPFLSLPSQTAVFFLCPFSFEAAVPRVLARFSYTRGIRILNMSLMTASPRAVLLTARDQCLLLDVMMDEVSTWFERVTSSLRMDLVVIWDFDTRGQVQALVGHVETVTSIWLEKCMMFCLCNIRQLVAFGTTFAELFA